MAGLLLLLLATVPQTLSAEVRRVVILKVDGLPGWLVERMLTERNPTTGRSPLPSIERVFLRNGVWVRNFYTRGVSLSVPAWSILDTGHPMVIRGNVEFDRYTLRAFDYLNFIPFYFKSAFSKAIDMPGVEVLDDLGIPLLADHFAPDETHQSFQLYQRGIRWHTLQRAARRSIPFTSPRELLDEWMAGFEIAGTLQEQIEQDLVSALADPRIRYLDLFDGSFDHTAHLDNSETAQRRVAFEVDALVGRVWSAIEKSPLAAHTLLALVSDHGMNTAPGAYSQGYNLVEWFRGAAGGGHHVVTNRHPLTEYKLRGLYPFVHKVATPSETSPYGSASAKDYPTALLDLDGNERAGVYLRNSDLNQLHLLLLQLQRSDLPVPVRKAAVQATHHVIARYTRQSRPRLDWLRVQLDLLRTQIRQLDTRIASAATDEQRKRLKARADSWRTDERAYVDTLAAIDRLTNARLYGSTPRAAQLLPKRFMGEPNTIHQLQNYVVALSPFGLQLAPDGTIDEERSFRRIDYFSRLADLQVRNVVQQDVGNRPVDFIAKRLHLTNDGGESADFAVWLHGGEQRQLLLLVRERDRTTEFKLVPVANLRQDAQGNIAFTRQNWRAGLPLELFEDEALAIPAEDRAQWLSAWHAEAEWLRATHRTRYSVAVPGLFEQFRQQPSNAANTRDSFQWTRRDLVEPDILLLARNHWNFNVRGFNPGGNHGSFLRISTQAVLMLSGGEATQVNRGVTVEQPYDALSFVPTLLALMGRCDLNLPGVLVSEAGPMPCAPTPPTTQTARQPSSPHEPCSDCSAHTPGTRPHLPIPE